MAAADIAEVMRFKPIVEWQPYDRILEMVGGDHERAKLVIAASDASTMYDGTILYKVVMSLKPPMENFDLKMSRRGWLA
jgi:hypothetical protein